MRVAELEQQLKTERARYEQLFAILRERNSDLQSMKNECDALLRALGGKHATEIAPLDAKNVEWVVNSNAELGVKIGKQFFFLWKGHSLAYDNVDDGPMRWRPVAKREFGEACHPRTVPIDGVPAGSYAVSPDGTKWRALTDTDPVYGFVDTADLVCKAAP